ncbi:MAG: reverse transcriptase domain-containing protein [Chloroflexota bacterium]|nr:reverse transcriptase domain-containing protein [Chloroflexota bacterium]
MRDAATVLGIIRERGMRKLPLEDAYRQLYNPQLFLLAYDRLRTNKGAMTPGVTGETIEGMSLEKIEAIIGLLRCERYRWTPTKRVYIPRKDGRQRPLGLPTWSDKLVQEVTRLLLEAYYEPQFCRHSHGFRPERGCHTALGVVQQYWTATRWFIEGDISRCFDTLDHQVMVGILGEKIHDNRFLRLIANMLKAGYLEEWTYNKTLSGSPQGGVVSPILSNIYLDKLDEYIVTRLMPEYNVGDKRKVAPDYNRLRLRRGYLRKTGRQAEAEQVRKQMFGLSSVVPDDPEFRRLRYVRYADDFLLGFDGPKEEARAIKERLRTFLRDHLKLELSEEKTLITHAATEKARFLGYELCTQWASDQVRNGKRTLRGQIGFRVPKDVIEGSVKKYMGGGKPVHRAELMHESDYTIVTKYQSEYRGLVNYYVLAYNIQNFSEVLYVMKTSLLKTLAMKHNASVTATARKYKAMRDTPDGQRSCFRVVVNRGEDKPPLVADFGGIPLKRQRLARRLDDAPPHIWTKTSDLVSRLVAQRCEMCGQADSLQVHHIRKMANLKTPGRREKPEWMKRMIGLRRKTLVVCHSCHVDIHAGRPMRRLHKPHPTVTGEPDT